MFGAGNKKLNNRERERERKKKVATVKHILLSVHMEVG